MKKDRQGGPEFSSLGLRLHHDQSALLKSTLDHFANLSFVGPF